MRAHAVELLAVTFLATGVNAQLDTTTTPALNLTAISAAEGESTLECWQLSPFTASSTAGTSGALSLPLGNTSASTSYTIIPSRFDGGLHNAPALQYVFFASGLAHISLPNGTDEAWIQGGKYGLIIAADTTDISEHGHRTRYPSDANAVALQVPLADGESFDYTILHEGPCDMSEMMGI